VQGGHFRDFVKRRTIPNSPIVRSDRRGRYSRYEITRLARAQNKRYLEVVEATF